MTELIKEGRLHSTCLTGLPGVTVKEFKSALKDPSLHAVFDALEISAGKALLAEPTCFLVLCACHFGHSFPFRSPEKSLES